MVILIGLSYGLSLLIGSVVSKKWEYLDKGIQPGMVELSNSIESDKSFNESTLNGANSYAKFSKENYSDYTKIGYLTPTTINDFKEYQKLQKMAFNNGTEFIGATGFNLIDSIIGETVYNSDGSFYRNNNGTIFDDEYKDKWMVIVDDSVHSSSIARQVISVRFETEYVGFAAGLAASIYATANEENKVSAFGGQAFNSVFDWMSGYEQGINWFNWAVLGYDLSYEWVNEDALLYEDHLDPIHLINGYKLSDSSSTGNELFIDYNNPTSQSNANLWYTGSFNIGDATTISTKQLDAGSKVIFPVAGGQVVDALNQISIVNQNSNSDYVNTMVIGVDADASEQYPSYNDYVLGSAIKNIPLAIQIGLWYVDRLILKYDWEFPSDALPIEYILNWAITHTSEESTEVTYNGETKEIYGWKEYKTDYTERDFAQMSDEEVESYYTDEENRDNNIAYSNDLSYEDYGEQYPDGYSSELVGTYNNGGCNFISSTILEESFQILIEEYNELHSDAPFTGDFFDFLDYAFTQNPVIENASNTFSAPGTVIKTSGMHSEYPWIPDWDVYHK
ncbi:MAG: hypothetical protein HPAVJP_5750 [Candidatus Hepatoplasma vulgare]|nr:MAG: hypothetical protein HPAVJP_5750 [Candidatus Hepatoplasma sp.]